MSTYCKHFGNIHWVSVEESRKYVMLLIYIIWLRYLHICLIYRQRHLQFNPPLEEVKAKYFREMKRFISIPNHFKGVGEFTENLIFPAIIDRHAEGFITCYKKADSLFKRLSAVQDQFKVSLWEIFYFLCKENWYTKQINILTYLPPFSLRPTVKG